MPPPLDVAEFRRIARFRGSELVLAATTTIAVLAFDVLVQGLFAMARVKQHLKADLCPTGFLERVREDRISMALPTAVRAYVRW